MSRKVEAFSPAIMTRRAAVLQLSSTFAGLSLAACGSSGASQLLDGPSFIDWDHTQSTLAYSVGRAGRDGKLYWLRLEKDSHELHPLSMRANLGTGWDRVVHQFGGIGGVIYAVDADGQLTWYKHARFEHGSEAGDARGDVQHASASDRTHWKTYDYMFYAGNGFIYGVTREGSLRWHQHVGYADGDKTWQREGGKEVHSGWNRYRGAFAAPNRVIYAIGWDDQLYWFRHAGQEHGGEAFRNTPGITLGTMWRDVCNFFAGHDGVIYGVKANGDLVWNKLSIGEDGSNPSWLHSELQRLGGGMQSDQRYFNSGTRALTYGCFPLVLYKVHRHQIPWVAARARELGLRNLYIHNYSVGKRNADVDFDSYQEYLDLAHAHGVKVMVQLHSQVIAEAHGKDYAMQRAQEVVDRFSSHPAVGMWYSFDEPWNTRKGAHFDADEVKAYTKMVRERMPQAPVCLSFNADVWGLGYRSVADLPSIQSYPVQVPDGATEVPAFPGVDLNATPDRTTRLLARDAQSMTAFQLEPKGRPVDARELRYMTFSALLQGGSTETGSGIAGALFYQAHISSPVSGDEQQAHDRWLSDVGLPAIKELESFTDLVAPAPHASWRRITHRSGEIARATAAYWYRHDRVWLVVVNDSASTRTLSIPSIPMPMDPTNGSRYTVHDIGNGLPDSSRPSLSMSGRSVSLTVEAPPWAVMMWKIK